MIIITKCFNYYDYYNEIYQLTASYRLRTVTIEIFILFYANSYHYNTSIPLLYPLAVCQHQMLWIQFNRAPDDGSGLRPKHVKRLTGNNKALYKVSSRWNFLKYIYMKPH
jgi:hypothetical protein